MGDNNEANGVLPGRVASEFHRAGSPNIHLHRRAGILSGWP